MVAVPECPSVCSPALFDGLPPRLNTDIIPIYRTTLQKNIEIRFGNDLPSSVWLFMRVWLSGFGKGSRQFDSNLLREANTDEEI